MINQPLRREHNPNNPNSLSKKVFSATKIGSSVPDILIVSMSWIS